MRQDPFPPTHAVTVPDLGVDGAPIRLVTWLVPLDARVIPGERLAEIEADGAVFQLDAPLNGVLTELRAAPDEIVTVGQTLAVITRGEADDLDQ